jgi:hypothetical protein
MSSHPRKNVSLRSVPTFINVKQTTGVARIEISGGYVGGKPTKIGTLGLRSSFDTSNALSKLITSR